MDEEQRGYLSAYFNRILFPVLTPLAVDRSRPFPFLANKSLNIAVRLQGKDDDEDCFAVVQVPSILSRYLELPSKKGRCFVLLENVIMYCMEELFEERRIRSTCPFRITRNSDLDIDEESEDLLIEIQKSIKSASAAHLYGWKSCRNVTPPPRTFFWKCWMWKTAAFMNLPVHWI